MQIDRNRLPRLLSIVTVGIALTVLSGCPGANQNNQSEQSTNDPPSGQPLPEEPGGSDVTPLAVEGAEEGGSVTQTILGRFVTLTAAPAEGYLFGGWDNLPSNDNPISLDGTGRTTVRVLFLLDGDGDGVADLDDACAETSPSASVDPAGCSRSQRDADGDLVADTDDLCPGTAPDADVDDSGCAADQRDGDFDGVTDDADLCPTTDAEDVGLVDATGCGPAELDTDADGVTDDRDECPDTSPLEASDAVGCAPSQRDADGDGVDDLKDQCPGTPEGAEDVNARGCAPAERDSDFDGLNDDADQCPDTTSGAAIDELGCELVFVDFGNDECDQRATVTNGVVLFTTATATTSTPPIQGDCDALGADVWFFYQATCAGPVTVSLCGSFFDTMLAVYAASSCPPTGDPLTCDDDFCRGGGGSQVTFTAVDGQSFLIRVGGWNGALGDGKLSISCGSGGGGGGGGCGPSAGDCFSDNGTPGCSEAACCELICGLIPFCCENNWDESCAVFANDLCEGGAQAICGNDVVELGEECDPPDGETCDSECQTLAVCGDNVVEFPEECDPPDGVECDTDCTFIPVCGNNRIERGEQCDPPNGDTCDDACQLIGGGGPSTWQAANDPFFSLNGFFIMTPVDYSLLADGRLDNAEVTIDANQLGVDPDELTIFTETIPVGPSTRLFRAEVIDPDIGPVAIDCFAQITAFEVDLLSGNPVSWSFDIKLTVEVSLQGQSVTFWEQYDGSQSGTIDGNRQTITWDDITGTFTLFDSVNGAVSSPLEDRFSSGQLGTWDKQSP